jgi:SAM-dependent methyltransferase
MSEMFTEAFWDDRYRTRTALWSGNPNPHLVAEADGLTPGTALDVGAGEGADAIWLARRGWRVTAVDLSAVALERAAAHAAEAGAGIAEQISWLHEDIISWDPGPGRYDLVSAQYMHLPAELRRGLFDRLAEAVATGGVLLIVGHHPSDLQTTIPRPPMPELFFTADDVSAGLDPGDWAILTSAARGRTAHDPDGNAVTIHDAVLQARRLRPS